MCLVGLFCFGKVFKRFCLGVEWGKKWFVNKLTTFLIFRKVVKRFKSVVMRKEGGVRGRAIAY